VILDVKNIYFSLIYAYLQAALSLHEKDANSLRQECGACVCVAYTGLHLSPSGWKDIPVGGGGGGCFPYFPRQFSPSPLSSGVDSTQCGRPPPTAA
jgi:hypothetical protein